MHWFYAKDAAQLRFAVVLGAALAFGNSITRVLTANFGALPGLALGAAATALLALGFSILFAAIAKAHNTPADG